MAIGCAVVSRRGLAEEICGGKEKRFRHMLPRRASSAGSPSLGVGDSLPTLEPNPGEIAISERVTLSLDERVTLSLGACHA